MSYSFHRCGLGHTYARPGKVNKSNHFIITNYSPICSSDVIDVPDDESEQSPQVVENDGPMPIFENIFEILQSPFVEEWMILIAAEVCTYFYTSALTL